MNPTDQKVAWLAEGNPPEVTPIDDLKPHVPGTGCWCGPFMDGDVIVHNAMDRREKTYEKGIVQ